MAKGQFLMPTTFFFLVGLAVTFVLVSVFFSDQASSYNPLSSMQVVASTPTATPISTPSSQITPPATFDSTSIEKIAAQSIQASNTALELMKWIIGTLVVIAGSVVSYFIKAQRDLLDYANSVRNELNEAGQKLITAEQQINKISSNYFHLLTELTHQSVVFLPPEMAISAFEQGKITKDEFRESQIWLAWANWYYTGKEEGFFQLRVYKESIQSLPHSIRRIMIVEIERIKEGVKKRGMIYKKEEELLEKLLFLLDLKIID